MGLQRVIHDWVTKHTHGRFNSGLPKLEIIKLPILLYQTEPQQEYGEKPSSVVTLSFMFAIAQVCVCVCVCARACTQSANSETPWTVACQAPLPMEFSRQEYWSGLPFPSPGDLSNPGIKPTSFVSLALADRFFTTLPPGKPLTLLRWCLFW